MTRAATWSSSFFRALYPSRCALCARLADAPICAICGEEFVPRDAEVHGIDSRIYPSRIYSIFPYEGRPAQAVQRLKYHRSTSLAEPMSHHLREALERMAPTRFDGIVPVPISPLRRRERGFNQCDLLCEGMDGRIMRPEWLRRVKNTRPQASLSVEERHRNLRDAFRCEFDLQGKSVLLIDDVATTGATLRACAAALYEAGVATLWALTYCGGPRIGR
ncbi:MAG: ComF family protein [Fimbriimonadaceae bacterium]